MGLRLGLQSSWVLSDADVPSNRYKVCFNHPPLKTGQTLTWGCSRNFQGQILAAFRGQMINHGEKNETTKKRKKKIYIYIYIYKKKTLNI